MLLVVALIYETQSLRGGNVGIKVRSEMDLQLVDVGRDIVSAYFASEVGLR